MRGCKALIDLVFPGYRLLLWITGSGGYGLPIERLAEQVLVDVFDGRFSPEETKGVYGVEVSHGQINELATCKRREDLSRRPDNG
jgi:N-methylhydantoinase B